MDTRSATAAGAVWSIMVLLWSSGARAEESASPREALTIERAVALAVEGGLALRAAEADVGRAEGRVRGARVLTPFNPELSGGGGVRLGRDGVSAEAEAGVSQEFELAGARRRRIAAAEAGLAAAIERREAALLRIAAEVRVAYVEAVTATGLLAIAHQGERLAASLHEVAAARGAADVATDLEVNLAAIEWAGARRAVASARRRSVEARLELGRLLALPRGEEILLPATLPPCPPIRASLEALLASASGRPALRAVERRAEAAEAEVAVTRAEAWPAIELSATYSLEEGSDHIASVGLAIPLPFFARNQGAIAEARSEAELARLDLEAARLSVERDVAAAYAAHEEAAEAASILDEAILGGIAQNLELLEVSLEEGRIGIVEVLLVQRELLAARREALDSRAATHRAHARLELAVGEEVE